jgi:hypothetical protein
MPCHDMPSTSKVATDFKNAPGLFSKYQCRFMNARFSKLFRSNITTEFGLSWLFMAIQGYHGFGFDMIYIGF